MCAHCDGYGLHAGVVIGAKDRKCVEGLARFIARPPLATPRLEELPDGGLRIRFKRPWSDGTEGVSRSGGPVPDRACPPDRLDAWPPWSRRHAPIPCLPGLEDHGVLAARSALRPRVQPREPLPSESLCRRSMRDRPLVASPRSRPRPRVGCHGPGCSGEPSKWTAGPVPAVTRGCGCGPSSSPQRRLG